MTTVQFNKEAHMSKPVYLLVLAQGFTEAWYQLSKEEQDKLWSQVQEVDKRAGVNWLISCDSRWADESVYGWAVLEYPDMDTYQKKAKELGELSWWRYFSAKTILGTKDEERQ
jgi:hypothetical protein